MMTCIWCNTEHVGKTCPAHEAWGRSRKGTDYLRRAESFPLIGVSVMLAQFKNFTVDRLDMDELLALSAFGKSIRTEYQNRELAVPAWISDQLASLDREILTRRRDELVKRQREIASQLATLETPTEKRERLLAEQKALETQLAGTGQ